MVPDIQERYYNLSKLFNILNIDEIHYSGVADLKLCQILAGLSPSARSIHPCYICEWNRKEPFVTAEERTIEKCEDNHRSFQQSGAKLINAKHYKNCINKSLITGEPDAKLVDLFAIPELHIMEGTVNTIVENIEKNLYKCCVL